MKNYQSPQNSPLRNISERFLEPIVNKLARVPGIEAKSYYFENDNNR